MKKIVIGLNKKDIDSARKYILNLKKQLSKMQQEFFLELAKWIVNKADGYIDKSDIGALVKAQIKSSWHYEHTANGITIINSANLEKTVCGKKQTVPVAVLVEFGSGIVGQSDAHPNATQEGYEYNVNSGYKSADGSWSFWLNSDERDLPMSAFSDFGTYDDHRKDGKRMVVTTFGAKGVWYAYNAVVDAKMELSKPNGGEIGAIWKQLKSRYIK